MDTRLTKNLYRVDEVCCMLRFALAHGKPAEAIAWMDELFMSGCIAEGNQILFEVWLFFKGVSDCQWLLDWYASDHNHQSALFYTARLASGEVDPRVFIEMLEPSGSDENSGNLNKKLSNILTHLTNPVTKRGIEAFRRTASKTKLMKHSPLQINMSELLIEATCFLPIDPAQIYGLSARGQLSCDMNTVAEIRGDIVERLRIQPTPYWENELLAYDSEDDDTIENFYEQHFPNDIPDEWSREAQYATHGVGSLGEAVEAVEVAELLRRLYSEGSIHDLCKRIDKKIPPTARTLFCL